MMKKYVACLIMVLGAPLLVSIFSIVDAHAADEGCECPKLACDPCSYERGVTFYTSKCGEQGTRLMSCKRPTCIPIDQANEACPNPPQSSSPTEPIVLNKGVDVKKESPDETPTAGDQVGKIKVIQGSVSIVHSDGKKSVVNKEAEVQETDTVESGADGTAVIGFNGGNKLHVHSNTVVEVKEFKDPQVEASRRVLLHLIKGKIRNQVEQKYNGKTSYYRVVTKAAVAGVRGTDFVMQFDDKDQLRTTVETLKGKVMLASLDEHTKQDIRKGEGATIVSDPSSPDVGKMGPLLKLSEEKIRELDRSSRVDLARKRDGSEVQDTPICSDPKGSLNQCVWKCLKNPSNQNKCRTDLSGVSCVRERCNGNGVWAEETQVSDGSVCPATGFLVKACDY